MRFSGFPIYLMLALASPLFAQTTDEPAQNNLADKLVEETVASEIAEQEAIAEDSDGSLDDATNSIDVKKVLDGISLTADIRAGYFSSETDDRDNTSREDDVVSARWRFRSEYGVSSYLRAVGRVAGLCSNDNCTPNLVLEESIPTTSGMAQGDITVDEAFLHWYRLNRFDLAVGRMQTKFVARGGVFAKSLDRNDSNGTNVNWTDGLHATFRGKTGWVPHLILQHNSTEGPTNIRRDPLDFDNHGARITYFFGIENLQRTPLFLQRGLDISYLPKSLLKDGVLSGRREDYYGIVIRSANRWPERNDGARLRIAAELGYAPETQTAAAAGLAGDGDADGLAWNVVLSLMEFKPNHSIGINYGEAGAGWLLSPNFRQNESLAEIRYQWRKNKMLAFDIRIRKRKDLEQQLLSVRKREEVDFFLRFTWGGTIK